MSLEREEAERAELRKMILGQSEKKPQINQTDQQISNLGKQFYKLSFINKSNAYEEEWDRGSLLYPTDKQRPIDKHIVP